MIGLMAGMFLAALDQSIVGHRPADHRLGSRWPGAHVLGGHRLPADLDRVARRCGARSRTSTAAGRCSRSAIVLFLIGSVISGAAGSMPMLIGGRAIQGIGGGGLIALALAIIGDIIPPRERGKYQGMFGAMFGVSSVAGPLLGGFFTDGPGWRWIFWLNIPIGLAALFITSRALHMPIVRREHRIDYLGAGLIVGRRQLDPALHLVGRARPTAGATPRRSRCSSAACCWPWRSSSSSCAPRSRSSRCRCSASRCSAGRRCSPSSSAWRCSAAIVFLPLYLQVVRGYTPSRVRPRAPADDPGPAASPRSGPGCWSPGPAATGLPDHRSEPASWSRCCC